MGTTTRRIRPAAHPRPGDPVLIAVEGRYAYDHNGVPVVCLSDGYWFLPREASMKRVDEGSQT